MAIFGKGAPRNVRTVAPVAAGGGAPAMSPEDLDRLRIMQGVQAQGGYSPAGADMVAIPQGMPTPGGDNWAGPDEASMQRTRQAAQYDPADLRRISSGEMPQARGMFGGGARRSGFSKFLNGAGKVLETVGAVAAYGPFAGMAMRGMKESRERQAQEHESEIGLRNAQAEYYRAQAGAKDDGLLVVGNKLIDRKTREVIMDGRTPGERESLLAELDDPTTPPDRASNIKRVLGITPAPRAEPAPSYQTDDNGNVFEVGPGGVRKVGGGLYKRPPEAPQPRETSPSDVAGPILAKLARGEALTPFEQQALEYAKPTDPMDTFMRRMLPGGGGMAPPPSVGMAPLPSVQMAPLPRAGGGSQLDANGNVPNPFGQNMPPAPPAMLRGRAAPPRPNPAGGNSGARVRLPAGYTPERARQEAAATIKRNPGARAEVIRRLQASGIRTAGL